MQKCMFCAKMINKETKFISKRTQMAICIGCVERINGFMMQDADGFTRMIHLAQAERNACDDVEWITMKSGKED